MSVYLNLLQKSYSVYCQKWTWGRGYLSYNGRPKLCHSFVTVYSCLHLPWIPPKYHFWGQQNPVQKSICTPIYASCFKNGRNQCRISDQKATLYWSPQNKTHFGTVWQNPWSVRFPPNFYRAILCIRGTSHGPVSVCLSVRPSVRPSQVGVLLKRLNVGSHKQHHTIPQRL